MVKNFTRLPLVRKCLIMALLAFSFAVGRAQTTINTTVGSSNYANLNGWDGNAFLTFVVQNGSGSDIILKQVASFMQTSYNNSTSALWYSSSSLSGVPTITSPAWTQIITGSPVPVPSNGIYDLFTNLSFTIPAGAEYRFAIQNSAGVRYSGGTSVTPTPDAFTQDGVTLKCGAAAISGSPVGYGGTFPGPTTTFSPRWFVGSITFEPAQPCTNPANAGTSVSTQTNVCNGSPFVLSLSGNTGGTGQTYQWQSSSNNTTYTNITGATSAAFTTSQSATTWYRNAVTCAAGTTVYSVPVQVTSPALVSGTFTINNAAPTGGGNFQSFTEAVDYIKCGINGPVTFNVQPGSGPYNERVTLTQVFGATASNKVTINGNGVTLANTSTDANNRTALVFNGADHFIIDSLTIDVTTGTYGWGVGLTNQADSNIIRKCTILSSMATASSNFMGIVMNGVLTTTASSGNAGNGNLFANNTINGGYYGAYLYGNSGSTTQNNDNKFVGNIFRDNYLYGLYAIYQSSGLVVSGNEFTKPSRNSTTAITYSAYLGTNTTNALVEKNRIHNMYDGMPTATGAHYCIYIATDGTATAPVTVVNNLIYNIGGNGAIYGIYNTSGDHMKAYHNTIAFDDQTATTGGAYGLYQTTAAAGLDYRNNNVYITRSGTGIKRCIYFVTTTSPIISNNNALYLNAAAGTDNKLGQFGTPSYAGLAEWKTANSAAFDQLSVSEDPVFTQASMGEYKPTAANLNNIGANLGIATDITGAARGSSPDPGAYEFALPACVAPPTAGTAAASAASVCPGGTVSLSLVGNSVGNTQTYQWQESPDNGTWTNIGTASGSSNLAVTQTASRYYRCVVTCSGNSQNSAVVYVISPALVSGTFTINNAAPTGGGNFASYAEAISSIACGINGPVVFNVQPGSGPYNEQVVIPQISGASATNTVTFNGNGTTLSFNSTDANTRYGIWLNGADFITLDSLVIDGAAGTYCWGIVLTNQADSNTIRKCVINNNIASTSTNYIGILSSGSNTSTGTSGNNANGNKIINNVITGGYYGIYLYGNSASTTQNVNNVVSGNIVKDDYFYGMLFTYLPGGLVVSGNEVTRPARATTTASVTYGIYLSTGVTGALLEKNRIHNMFDAIPANTGGLYAFYLAADGTAALPNRLVNNLVYSIGSNGAQYGIYNSSADHMKAYHNTISLDDNATTTGAAYGIYQTTAAVGIDVRNNIVAITRGGTGIKRCLYYVTTTSAITSNYNVLYMNPGAGTDNKVGQFGTVSYTGLADWQTASSGAFDQASSDGDPVFTSLSSGDLKPTSTTIGGSGDDAGVTTDILGVTRSTSPTPGAYELAVSCPAPGNVTAGTISYTGITYTWTAPAVVPASYSYELRTSGAAGSGAAGLLASGTINTLSQSFINLTPGTTYDFYVRANCGGSSGSSAWRLRRAITYLYQPVLVTGFNFDVIANGVGHANTSSNNSVDNPATNASANYAYISADYRKDATVTTAPPYSIPVNGKIVNGAKVFQLASYNANNSLKLSAQNATDTLKFVAPTTVRSLYVLDVSGSGTSVVDFKVLFADGTSKDVTGVSINDWFGTFTNTVMGSVGRVSRDATGGDPTGTDLGPNFYENVIDLTGSADTNKLVTGIKFTKTNVTGTGYFNVFAVSAIPSNGSSLPVSLVDFKGSAAGTINKLEWTTATETNNAGFELERSADGSRFSSLAYVASKAVNGTSSSSLSYSFNDVKPFTGNGWYRLKQVDKDGKATYSQVVLIKRTGVKAGFITSVFPNPAVKELTVSLSAGTEKLSIVVSDLTGKAVMQLPVAAGAELVRVPVQQLAAGTYFIKTICSTGCEGTTFKFVKQ